MISLYDKLATLAKRIKVINHFIKLVFVANWNWLVFLYGTSHEERGVNKNVILFYIGG